MMRRLRIAFLSFGAVACALSQEGAKPDQWRGLRLDESSVDQAIQALGKPVSDKQDGAAIRPIQRWFRPDLGKKIFRDLTFKEVEGFGRVDLYFLDEKLAMIQLQVKSGVLPTALQNIYGLEFQPMMSGFEESMGVVERHQGKAYPKSFPSFYNVVAVGPTAVVNAYVRNDGIGAVLSKSFGSGIDTAAGGFPGKVGAIQLISRRLENRAGTDLLK
jgi:hypothetical protein